MDSVAHSLKTNTLVIITGPSGVGKGTLCRQLLSTMPALSLCISATTRAMRPGEIDGVDYYFLTPEQFEHKVAENAFLEWAKYANASYGTLQSELARISAEGKIPMLEIDTQGALQIKAKIPDVLLLFISPPSFETLKERLIQRGTNTPQDIETRLEIARQEIEIAKHFNVIIENNLLADAMIQVQQAIEQYLA